jgi:hypothetical protein
MVGLIEQKTQAPLRSLSVQGRWGSVSRPHKVNSPDTLASMWKLLVLASFVGCASSFTTVSRAPGPQPKPSLVAVIGFAGSRTLFHEGDPEGGDRAVAGCRQALTSAGISLVPRAQVEAAIKGVSVLDDATAAAIGKSLGADRVIIGSTLTGKFDMIVEARVLRPDGTLEASVRSNEGVGEGDAIVGISQHVCAALFR